MDKAVIFEDTKSMINIKNNNKYILLTDKIINATNSNDGQRMCLYIKDEQLYIREKKEFDIKFKEEMM